MEEKLKIIGVPTQDVERTRIELEKTFRKWEADGK
jgi:hypothetical protein